MAVCFKGYHHKTLCFLAVHMQIQAFIQTFNSMPCLHQESLCWPELCFDRRWMSRHLFIPRKHMAKYHTVRIFIIIWPCLKPFLVLNWWNIAQARGQSVTCYIGCRNAMASFALLSVSVVPLLNQLYTISRHSFIAVELRAFVWVKRHIQIFHVGSHNQLQIHHD